MAVITLGGYAVDLGQVDLVSMLGHSLSASLAGQLTTTSGATTDTLYGQFSLSLSGALSGGTLTRIVETEGGSAVFDISGISLPVADLLRYAASGDKTAAMNAVLAGADTITGSALADILRGLTGADSLSGGGGDDVLDGGDGDDVVSGGAGNDQITGGSGSNVLRGDDGQDQLSGGAGFDDINGNAGDDTAHGEAGDDWVVGGKNNDQLYGDAGDDIVYGNLGDDTVNGGAGADIVRGGQGNDSVSGGAGNDVVFGDRGDDTESGGAGADLFHFFAGAGHDRILDFNYAEGDRIVIEGGATWSISISGGDTVVSLGADTLTLVGVNAASLAADWIGLG